MDVRRVLVRLLNIRHQRGGRSLVTLFDERLDLLAGAAGEYFDTAVAAVADPAAEAERARPLHRPAAIKDALNAAVHAKSLGGDGHRPTIPGAGIRVSRAPGSQIGRAHVRTPVTNAHLVCRLLLEKKHNQHP